VDAALASLAALPAGSEAAGLAALDFALSEARLTPPLRAAHAELLSFQVGHVLCWSAVHLVAKQSILGEQLKTAFWTQKRVWTHVPYASIGRPVVSETCLCELLVYLGVLVQRFGPPVHQPARLILCLLNE